MMRQIQWEHRPWVGTVQESNPLSWKTRQLVRRGGSSGDKKPTVVERNASPEGQADTRGPMPNSPVPGARQVVLLQYTLPATAYDKALWGHTNTDMDTTGPTQTWDKTKNSHEQTWDDTTWNASKSTWGKSNWIWDSHRWASDEAKKGGKDIGNKHDKQWSGGGGTSSSWWDHNNWWDQ